MQICLGKKPSLLSVGLSLPQGFVRGPILFRFWLRKNYWKMNEWCAISYEMRHQCVGLTPTKKLHDVRRRIHHGIAKWLPQLASSIAWIALFSSFRTFSANIVIFCQWSFLDSIFYTTLTSSRESTASCTAAL